MHGLLTASPWTGDDTDDLGGGVKGDISNGYLVPLLWLIMDATNEIELIFTQMN